MRGAFGTPGAEPCVLGPGVERSATVISAGVSSRQFIGRSRELAFLEGRVAELSCRGGCVCVRGEAGIGKSRLVAEFAQRVRDRGVHVVTGWTREYANAPYAAFTEALEGLQVDALPAPGQAHETDRAAWFGEVAQALRTAVGDRPSGVVVALEDLQWADPATIDLLRFCASRLADAPILFVASYRSEDEATSSSDRALAFAGIERDADVLTLRPLPPGQIEHLIRGVLSDTAREIPPNVIADVRDLSDGRPLFAEELLRGVFDRIDRDEGSAPSVPSSIRAAVRERFLTLDESGRELLLQASVLGLRFSAKRLTRLSNVHAGASLATMRRARDLGLVVEVQDETDGDTFAFRHALTREAIYADMLRAEARSRHADVARLLVEETPVDVAAVAEHTWRARDGENAAEWNERAGTDAATFFAFGEAVRAYERAYESSTDEARRARVAHKAANAAYQVGDIAATARWFGAAARAYEALGDGDLAVRFALRRARSLVESGQFEDGLREAQAIAVPLDDASQRFEVDTMIAGMLAGQGRADEALERLRFAEKIGAHPDPAITARFTATYAHVLSLLGPSGDARERWAQTVASAEQLDDLDMLPRTLNNWANFEVNWGSLEQARMLYRRGLAAAEEMKSVRHIAWLLSNAAIAAVLAADLDEAGALLDRAEHLEHSMSLLRLWHLALRVRIATLMGDDAARLAEEAARALELSIASEDSRGAEILGAALAYRAAAFGSPAEAARFVSLGAIAIESALAPFWLLDCAARFGTPDERRRARLRLTGAAKREGALAARAFGELEASRDAAQQRKRDEAVRLAEDAAGHFAAAGWRLEEAFALEAAGKLADALARFREMGATGEVRRLTELTSAGRRRGDATLTAREREIAALLLAGRTARAIADALVISERTVETHVAAIYRKLGVANRAELTALYDRPGAAP